MKSVNPYEKSLQIREDSISFTIGRMQSKIQSLTSRISNLEINESQNQSFRHLFSHFFQKNSNNSSDIQSYFQKHSMARTSEPPNLLGKVTQQLMKVSRGDCENQRFTDISQRLTKVEKNIESLIKSNNAQVHDLKESMKNLQGVNNSQINALKKTINQIIPKLNDMQKSLIPMIQSQSIKRLLKKDDQLQQSKAKAHLESYKDLSKSKPSALIDTSIPGFHFVSNIIMLATEIKTSSYFPNSQQVLFNAVIGKRHKFVFHTRIIKSQLSCLIIGAVDRRKQKSQKSSYASPNVIAYHIGEGVVRFTDKGKNFKKQAITSSKDVTGIIGILMEVNMPDSSVAFTLQNKTQSKKFFVKSDILQEADRQFVPYYEFYHQGDALQWSII